ncbi:hypothetical protein LJR225_004855 [Phenylobacterium sp. LjRoot225]|uniref:hypothetical protein n=1 Tax=Phenylobacterium sp. LjRoot225 TaxID=3342285 RepID=UPI003ECE205E
MDVGPRLRKGLIYGGIGAIASGVTLAYIAWPSDRATAQVGSFVRNGEAGFVVTHFAYALGPDAAETGACPNGMSKSALEIFAETPEGRRHPGEGDEEYGKRLEAGGKSISTTSDGKNYCMHPELAPPDPHTRILTSASVPAEGIDLDGKISRSKEDAQRGLLDFTGVDGAKGVDNQFWRAVGCNKSFQKSGHSNSFETEMYTGSWGILITLSDVDDLRNDDHVDVGIYANADPIQVSPTRVALEYATYAMDQDKAFRASTTGRLENGVLTTEPVDIRARHVVNSMQLQRPLRDARIRASLSADGVIKGYLAGYTPVIAMYDFQFGYRNASDASGKPSPMARRLLSSNGAARSLGHTCHGMYQSLHRLADGHPDPQTGRFTSISTQYQFEARPAFVVDVKTKSVNAKLIRHD